ncbi:conserved hypothetical protein [Vibrio crassostreae]|nr:conserved hypothetical protein [Vibrio crassostreae]
MNINTRQETFIISNKKLINDRAKKFADNQMKLFNEAITELSSEKIKKLKRELEMFSYYNQIDSIRSSSLSISDQARQDEKVLNKFERIMKRYGIV